MKPSVEEVLKLCKSATEEFVVNHIERLGEEYFETFQLEKICRHIESLAQLSPDNPIQLEISRSPENIIDCTILAFNYRTQFSLLTGILTSMGLNIISGSAFTYAPPELFTRQRLSQTRLKELQLLRRRYIVDQFSTTFLGEDIDLTAWEKVLNDRLQKVMQLMESGRDDDTFQARNMVNHLVADRLADIQIESLPTLYPVDIQIINKDSPFTTLRVTAQDTPAFMYALSNALGIRGISIERVEINTISGVVEDIIGILDSKGAKINDTETLNQIKLSVLLTKQFTYFLPEAPDPYAALSRFEHLISDIVALPERSQWTALFSNPDTLQDLAKILGASDFLWEDFVRSQYEALLSTIDPKSSRQRISFTKKDLKARLDAALNGAKTYEEKRQRLNDWKDHEIFTIDVDHMLQANADVRALAQPITYLAKVVIREVTDIVYRQLTERYGIPRTVGGIKATYAVMGLGKFGGVALGYASDIELLFVYSDSGKTDGLERIENAQFFEALAEETTRFITAKREGIFHIDLRLRPYGESGPKATSLDRFIRYYGLPGKAHSYERLALTRLRAVAGDPSLGAQVERLRDEFVYNPGAIDMKALQQLREKQFETKVSSSKNLNAKFSPGALVDVEYYVQILQVNYGDQFPKLRTPRIHLALEELSRAGILKTEESIQLTDAYYFLRHLINGLRMLRGSAVDLFLPPADSDEYIHLARRMGYKKTRQMEPQQQLNLDFEMHTAIVRSFIKKHFGRENATNPDHGNVVDLILVEEPSQALKENVLREAGCSNVNRSFINLKRLAGQDKQKELFLRIALLAADIIKRLPDSDMALNNWERFVDILDDAQDHYRVLSSQPKRLDILLRIFAASQFLADTLVRNPEFLDWVTNPEILRGSRSKDDLEKDLREFIRENTPGENWQNSLRRFRRREMLRIGTRDVCLDVPIENVMTDLSALADTITATALSEIWKEAKIPVGVLNPENSFCVLALGKLGGYELNYSSDIDLVGFYNDLRPADEPKADLRKLYARILERLRQSLSDHTREGYAYRVDFRLRPFGKYGELVQPISAMVEYYTKNAALWEIQAILKSRPIAGSLETGYNFIEAIKPQVMQKRERKSVVFSIRKMRSMTIESAADETRIDVKSGIGGIRDVEFLIQGLQLLHLPHHPELFTGNTLRAMDILGKIGVLPTDITTVLKDDYLFLRRVEHYLQILEDLQIHELPRKQEQLAALARRAMEEDTTIAEFMIRLQNVREWIHRVYEIYLV